MKLAVDPGQNGSGWALFGPGLVASGQLEASSSRGMAGQIRELFLVWRVEGVEISEACIEDQYVTGASMGEIDRDPGDGPGDRIKRLMSLARNAGAWEYACLEAGALVTWAPPGTWKKDLKKEGRYEAEGLGPDEADAVRIGRWRGWA